MMRQPIVKRSSLDCQEACDMPTAFALRLPVNTWNAADISNMALGSELIPSQFRRISGANAGCCRVGLRIEDLEQVENADHFKGLRDETRRLDQFYVPAGLGRGAERIHQ